LLTNYNPWPKDIRVTGTNGKAFGFCSVKDNDYKWYGIFSSAALRPLGNFVYSLEKDAAYEDSTVVRFT